MLAFPLPLQVEGRIHCCIIKSGLGHVYCITVPRSSHFSTRLKSGARHWSICRSSTPAAGHVQLNLNANLRVSATTRPTDVVCFHLNQPNNKNITIRPHAVPLTTTIQDVCTSGLLRSPWPPCSLQPHAIHCHAHLCLDHFQAC